MHSLDTYARIQPGANPIEKRWTERKNEMEVKKTKHGRSARVNPFEKRNKLIVRTLHERWRCHCWCCRSRENASNAQKNNKFDALRMRNPIKQAEQAMGVRSKEHTKLGKKSNTFFSFRFLFLSLYRWQSDKNVKRWTPAATDRTCSILLLRFRNSAQRLSISMNPARCVSFKTIREKARALCVII